MPKLILSLQIFSPSLNNNYSEIWPSLRSYTIITTTTRLCISSFLFCIKMIIKRKTAILISWLCCSTTFGELLLLILNSVEFLDGNYSRVKRKRYSGLFRVSVCGIADIIRLAPPLKRGRKTRCTEIYCTFLSCCCSFYCSLLIFFFFLVGEGSFIFGFVLLLFFVFSFIFLMGKFNWERTLIFKTRCYSTANGAVGKCLDYKLSPAQVYLCPSS